MHLMSVEPKELACRERERNEKRERKMQKCWAKQRKICARPHGRHRE